MKRQSNQKINITSRLKPFQEIPIIKPEILYSISDILKLGLIPNVPNTKYGISYIYRLITDKYKEKKVVPREETTRTTIKPVDVRKPGGVYPSWRIEGVELLKFLYLNKVIKK